MWIHVYNTPTQSKPPKNTSIGYNGAMASTDKKSGRVCSNTTPVTKTHAFWCIYIVINQLVNDNIYAPKSMGFGHRGGIWTHPTRFFVGWCHGPVVTNGRVFWWFWLGGRVIYVYSHIHIKFHEKILSFSHIFYIFPTSYCSRRHRTARDTRIHGNSLFLVSFVL